MTPLQPLMIAGSAIGLRADIKPYLMPEQAFSSIENAYVWRERVKKRECFEFVGRLRRQLTAVTVDINGNPITITLTLASPNTFNLFTLLGLSASEPNAQIQPGTGTAPIDIVIDAQTLTDNTGTGVFTVAPAGNITAASINYATGNITIIFTAGTGALAVAITMFYYPGLPVMGIWQREVAAINDEPTLFFDTKYCYIFTSPNFDEFLPGTTWAGTDSDFFWSSNYRGIEASDRLFFTTNFVNNAANPMRYTDGGTWTNFYPVVSESAAGNPATRRIITSARIIIPYYGRLLLMNTWEGDADNAGNPTYGTPRNFYNRCSFSQIGNPLEVYNKTATPKTGAFAIDIFGKGGFIDAPTDEQIISAYFVKNTLIVLFERSTWQLRYVGEYGLPFLWERVSSDFGSESTFSGVVFDDGIAAIGDRAIISANPVTATRIDPQIPDFVFTILNDADGVKRVNGVRDFQRELVFWAYPDSNSLGPGQYFPNKVLVFNYKNNTYSIFDDNVTFFGTLQPTGNITWNNTDILWENTEIKWDDVDNQSKFPRIVAGNQQGFVGYYGYTRPDEQSLMIQGFNNTSPTIQLVSANHNLQSISMNFNIQSGEIIKITNAKFSGADPGFNNQFYEVQYLTVNTVNLYIWNGTDFVNCTLDGSTYVGGGTITVYPRLFLLSKDFNPYLDKGGQLKLSYIDFLFDASEVENAVSIILFANASAAVEANLLTGNKGIETSLPSPFYVPASEYAWHRFYATVAAQFVRVAITYNDTLMATDSTHAEGMTLNAYTLWVRPGGKVIF